MQKTERFPATGTKRDAPHTSRAVRGCGCMSCEAHRWLVRLDERDLARAKRYEDAPMIGEVAVGRTATQEFAAAVGGRYEP